VVTFHETLDHRTRVPRAPEVARWIIGPTTRYVVIGTQYGSLHTISGDTRTWRTPGGARRAIRRYVPL
jgi:hypothetical protein